MIIIADSNIFMSALVNPTGRTASILAERKKIHLRTILAWIFSPITALYIGLRWIVRKIFGKRRLLYTL